jgi:hypothetical protein
MAKEFPGALPAEMEEMYQQTRHQPGPQMKKILPLQKGLDDAHQAEASFPGEITEQIQFGAGKFSDPLQDENVRSRIF